MAYNFSHLKDKVKEIEEWFKKELSQIRTGRATPAILDSVQVESYGAKMPINQIGSVAVEDARSLRITPWDMSQIKNIEKAIQISNLGLSVTVDDKGLRVIFPELTSDRRVSLIKAAKEKLEDARVKFRSIRDEIWKDIQAKEKEGGMGEDEKFRLKTEMQKLVDAGTKTLDEAFERKEKEVGS